MTNFKEAGRKADMFIETANERRANMFDSIVHKTSGELKRLSELANELSGKAKDAAFEAEKKMRAFAEEGTQKAKDTAIAAWEAAAEKAKAAAEAAQKAYETAAVQIADRDDK